MARREGDTNSDWERLRSRDKRIGQFVFWVAVSLIGWSFITTLAHDNKLPVIEQRLTTNESEIKILRRDHRRHENKKSHYFSKE